ncbi:hypothetical protein KO506_05495 [Polaribacter vadi]|uniref:hypothetical protein n=1 Tax=Polaribacter TaxID=52959 RepID=UPI001C0A0293|nr:MULTISPECIES: hypothetical protein [Polaribacter]MBU3010845.1 hypothetical protein [Polaribacter vadi]MDO6740657.1 hypothetical protein [Polaribacter sp. 1_MG-2023]
MKKIISVLIVILFLACSSDDDSNCESCRVLNEFTGKYIIKTHCNNGDGTVTISNSTSATPSSSTSITVSIPNDKTFEEYVNESCNN